MYTMCPPGCYHNGFMATPELGHRMYTQTNTGCVIRYFLKSARQNQLELCLVRENKLAFVHLFD